MQKHSGMNQKGRTWAEKEIFLYIKLLSAISQPQLLLDSSYVCWSSSGSGSDYRNSWAKQWVMQNPDASDCTQLHEKMASVLWLWLLPRLNCAALKFSQPLRTKEAGFSPKGLFCMASVESI